MICSLLICKGCGNDDCNKIFPVIYIANNFLPVKNMFIKVFVFLQVGFIHTEVSNIYTITSNNLYPYDTFSMIVHKYMYAHNTHNTHIYAN